MNLSSLGNEYNLRGELSVNKTTANNHVVSVLFKGAGSSPIKGASYTLGSDNLIVGPENAAAIAKDLALKNKAVYFPYGTVNISKSETDNKVLPTTYASNNKPTPTGRIADTFTVTFNGYYDSRELMNTLRSNSDGFDLWLFTNDTVEMYSQVEFDVQITNVRDAVAGDNTFGRNGMFDIDVVGQGQAIPLFGINYADLKNSPKFILTTGTLNNLTLGTCSGDYKRYSRTTSGTIAKLPFETTTNSACVTYSLFVYVSGKFIPATGSTYASVNTLSGEITFQATGHTTSPTKYLLRVENETGVRGEYKLEFINS